MPAFPIANLVIYGCRKNKPPWCENQELANAFRFWDLEWLSITETQEEKTKEFLEHIKFAGPKYEVGIPWKEGQKDQKDQKDKKDKKGQKDQKDLVTRDLELLRADLNHGLVDWRRIQNFC